MEGAFSEFSYGFALTREITNASYGTLRIAPIFPSQYQEGQAGGHDVELPLQGGALFLQFKLSHYMRRPTAKEWPSFGRGYYRMHLRPIRHSRQHILLSDLENQGKAVYYVAPRFHSVAQLNDTYATGTVLERSAFFRPSSIDLGNPPDLGPHYVAFDRTGKPSFCCSDEPRRMKDAYTVSEMAEVERLRVKERGSKLDETFFAKLSDLLIDILTERNADTGRAKELRSRLSESNVPARRMVEYAAYLTRVFLDTELFVVSDHQNQPS
jgi:hypothetical protein